MVREVGPLTRLGRDSALVRPRLDPWGRLLEGVETEALFHANSRHVADSGITSCASCMTPLQAGGYRLGTVNA